DRAGQVSVDIVGGGRSGVREGSAELHRHLGCPEQGYHRRRRIRSGGAHPDHLDAPDIAHAGDGGDVQVQYTVVDLDDLAFGQGGEGLRGRHEHVVVVAHDLAFEGDVEHALAGTGDR